MVEPFYGHREICVNEMVRPAPASSISQARNLKLDRIGLDSIGLGTYTQGVHACMCHLVKKIRLPPVEPPSRRLTHTRPNYTPSVKNKRGGGDPPRPGTLPRKINVST